MSNNSFIDQPYDPAPESSPVTINDSYGLFIDNKFVEPASGGKRDTGNPATGEKLSTVAEAGVDDVDSAVKAARRAYEKSWSKMIRTGKVSLSFSSIDPGKRA
jgi:aldehyde dehydrogenase (NAD+)